MLVIGAVEGPIISIIRRWRGLDKARIRPGIIMLESEQETGLNPVANGPPKKRRPPGDQLKISRRVLPTADCVHASLRALPVDLGEIGTDAAEFARSSRSAATERAYRFDWADFTAWYRAAGLVALPAEPTTVGAYLTYRAGTLKVATPNRRIAPLPNRLVKPSSTGEPAKGR
jgi:hypothetical protein